MISAQEFTSLIKKDKFQFFVFSSPCSLPLSFALHSWIVTNDHGEVHRYEVWSYKSRFNNESGHISIDFYPATTGLTLLPGPDSNISSTIFGSTIIGYVEGGEGSLAHRMADFVESRHKEYPNKFKYHYFPGPNSNTFVQWILNNFPECKIKLPWNAFGK